MSPKPARNRPAPATAERRFVLSLEASTPAAGVALADAEGHLLAQFWSDSRVPASARVLGLLDHVLREFEVTPERVAAIAVAHGPGGFTGLRVALAQAKTLAHTWRTRLYGFSTLEALAARWPAEGDLVAPLLDARRGEVYSGLYTIPAGGGRPYCLMADAVESLEGFLDRLARNERGSDAPRIRLTGSGAARYREELTRALGERANFIPESLANPAPDALAMLGVAELVSDAPGIDPLAAGPVYLRPSDAEVRHGIDVSGIQARTAVS